MFKIRWSILLLLGFMLIIKAQQTEWEQINSNTAVSGMLVQRLEARIADPHITQIGNFNTVNMYLTTRSGIMIQQLGDYNTLNFRNTPDDREIQTSIMMKGNNNMLDITGSNTISDKMQISLQGDHKTIFMRNYSK